MRAGSLFSGIGLLDYGLSLAGIEHAFLCEADPWRREILSLRWPGVPIYADVREVDGSAPGVDLLVGGFPCKGASTAGKRTGLDHPETALWREMARVLGELLPRFALLENVANLLAVREGEAWGEILGDLASLGYVCGWDCLPAAAFGAPHLRDRVFAVAFNAESEYCEAGRKQRAGLGRAQGGHPESAALSDGADELGNGGNRREQNGRADAGGSSKAAPDRALRPKGRDPKNEARGLATEPNGIPVLVEFGEYEPAVSRWRALFGAAPAPILRGVDARGSRRVVRSRLSALGDGVQVQIGHLIGTKLMKLWEDIDVDDYIRGLIAAALREREGGGE